MGEACVWLDRPCEFELDGDGVLLIGHSGERSFSCRLSRANARNIAERLKWALDDADSAIRADNIARLRSVHSAASQ